MDVNDLRAQRAARREEVRSLNDLAIREERDLTEDEQRSWEAAQRDIAHLSSTISRLDYIRQLDEDTVVVTDAASTQPAVRQVLPLARASSRRELATLPRDERYADAFYSYLRHGMGGMDPESRSILQPYFGTSGESRAMGTTSVAVGGALIPQDFYRRLIEALKEIGGVRRSRATVVQTDSGAPMPIPLVDDTANVGAILAENTAVTEQDITFAQKTLGSFMYTSKLVRVSFQMLQDSAFDIESWLARALAMRLGRAINAHFTTGTGGGTQPEGVVTGAQSYGTTAAGAGNVTGVTYDNLVNLIHSVDPAYRENAEWMFNDSTLKAIKQIKDSQNRPLWQQDMALGERPTILGYPYVINQDVAVMAASAKSILFGDFSYYLIRDVQDIRLLRLDERYADFLQSGFLAFLRTDGLLANAGGTNAPVKYYANSAT
jgi:HK97 family phage major capsid protein